MKLCDCKAKIFFGLMICFWVLPITVFGQESSLPAIFSQESFTGDWAGARPKLTEHGLDLEFIYTGEFIATLKGGLRRDIDVLHNFDLTLNLDLQKALGWQGASIFIYGLGNQGGDPSATDIGDFQAVKRPILGSYMSSGFSRIFFRIACPFFLACMI